MKCSHESAKAIHESERGETGFNRCEVRCTCGLKGNAWCYHREDQTGKVNAEAEALNWWRENVYLPAHGKEAEGARPAWVLTNKITAFIHPTMESAELHRMRMYFPESWSVIEESGAAPVVTTPPPAPLTEGAPEMVTCPRCDGGGLIIDMGGDPSDCPKCGMAGVVEFKPGEVEDGPRPGGGEASPLPVDVAAFLEMERVYKSHAAELRDVMGEWVMDRTPRQLIDFIRSGIANFKASGEK